MKKKRIAIIGDGMVGSTLAYTLFLQETAESILLIDTKKEKADSDALDMNHALHLTGAGSVKGGNYEDLKDCDIIVITASIPGRYIKSRDDLLIGNADLFKNLCEQIKPHLNDKAVLIVISNPVDVMAALTAILLEIDPMRVIGSGCVLDSSRLSWNIASRLGVDPKETEADVVGEHGDSEVPVFSTVKVAGKALTEFLKEKNLSLNEEEISKETIQGGNLVQSGKGYTNFAIAAATAHIIKALTSDKPIRMCASTFISVESCYLSLPVGIDETGIVDIDVPDFTDEEQTKFEESIKAVKKNLSRALTHLDKAEEAQE